jgi:iron complex outermembrane receptor protein
MRYLMMFMAATLAVGHTSPVSAETNLQSDMEEVVVIGELSTFGATKSNSLISEIPRSVSVIAAEEFLNRGALNLSNTLEYTAGVVGNAYGPATRGDFTSIRGLDAPEYQDNLQVLFGFYNNARVDIYTLEQVEVLKGPASVLYGQAAPGGIVSTVSKLAGPGKQDKEVVVTAGNHDRYQVSADAGFDLTGDGTWTARLVGIYRDSDTQVDYVEDDALVIAPSITYATDNSSLSLLVNYTERQGDTAAQFLPLTATACGNSDVTISEPAICATSTGLEIDSDLYVGDPGFNKYETEATTISLFGTHAINDRWAIEGTARYRDNEADYDQTWISFLGAGTPRLQPDGTAVGRTWNSAPAGSEQKAFDLRLRGDLDTGSVRHELLIGANYQNVETETNSANLYALPTAFNVFNPVYDGSEIPTAAAFDAVRAKSSDETTASDVYLTNNMYLGNLVATAGVRFSSVESKDAANDQDDDETPITLGLLYKTRLGLNPYVSYAESFRATVGTDVNTGSSLKPREGEQTEVGIKYQPEGSNSLITFAYFDLEENNLVDFVAGGRTQPGLTIETRGFEVEALLVLDDFTFDFNYRHLDAEEVDEFGVSVPRPSLPDNAGSLWTNWTPSDIEGLRVGVGVRYASENESNGTAFLPANAFAPTPVQVKTDGYTVVDAMIGYEWAGYDLTLNLRNIGDKDFYATCLSRGDCFPGEQRTVVGTITRKF